MNLVDLKKVASVLSGIQRFSDPGNILPLDPGLGNYSVSC